MTTALALSITLKVTDRCDRCGVQAYIHVALKSGGELLFCAHHGREHLPKLQDLAASIVDETIKLVEEPPIGAF